MSNMLLAITTIKHSKQLLLLLTTLFWLLLQSGCAIHPEQEAKVIAPADKAVATTVQQKTAEPSIASQSLTAELLYDLTLAELAMQRQDYDLAFKLYFNAAQETQDSRLAKKATRVTLYSKNDTQTFKAVALWSKLQPDNIDVQQIYVASLITKKKDAKALTHLKKIVQLSESFESGVKRVFNLIKVISEQERANYFFQNIVNKYQTHSQKQPLIKLYQAKLAFKFTDYPATQNYLEDVLTAKPDYIDALSLKVDLLKKQNKDIQAIEILTKIIQKLPDNIGLRLELSRLLVKNKRYEAAFTQVERLAEEDLSPEILFAISLLAIEVDKIDEAKDYLERLHSFRLYSSEAAYFIAQLESGRDNYAEAEQWFKRVKNGKYTFEAYLGLVMVYAQQEKFEQAFKLLEHSNGYTEKQSSDILQIKAEVYVQAKDLKKAYDIYNQAVAADPKNHDLLYGRAMLSEKMGRIDLLERDLLRILAENPKDSQSLNALGYTLADKTTRYQEAFHYIDQALKINPDDVATLDSMGWVLYKMGQPVKALSYLKKAYEKDADSEIAAHYGEVLWTTGQTKKAKKVWNEALKKDPKHHILIGIMSHYLDADN